MWTWLFWAIMWSSNDRNVNAYKNETPGIGSPMLFYFHFILFSMTQTPNNGVKMQQKLLFLIFTTTWLCLLLGYICLIFPKSPFRRFFKELISGAASVRCDLWSRILESSSKLSKIIALIEHYKKYQ